MIKQLQQSRATISKFEEEKEKLKKGALELISNRKRTSIYYENILYIESLADYVNIHTTDANIIRSKTKISHLEGTLPEIFIRVHRSFIVNRQFILKTSFDNIVLQNNTEIPIGRSYSKGVKESLKQ